MSTAVSISMPETAISISDWLLSFLKVRNPELYEDVYNQMFAALEKKPLDMSVFNLLLEHQREVFHLLTDVKEKGFVTMKVPNPNAHDGRGDWIEKHKKSQEVIREVEEFFLVLLEMAIYFDGQTEQPGGRLGDILGTIIADQTNHCELRLKLVMFAYNMLPVDSIYRYATFKEFLSYAAKVKLFAVVLPYMDLLDDWQQEWGLTPKQRREMYSLIINQLELDTQNELLNSRRLFHFLRRYVEACHGEGAELLADAETVSTAAKLVKAALLQTDIFTSFDTILSLQAVQHLNHTSHAPLVQLLEVFVRGTPTNLQAFHDQHPQLFKSDSDGTECQPQSIGLEYKDCLAKCHLLTLVSLAGDSNLSSGQISLPEASQRLGLDEAATENLTVRAITERLIVGKIDQINKTVTITSALQREFGPSQWEALLQRIVAWNQNTTKVIHALQRSEASDVVL